MKGALNETHQNPEMKFPWDARVPFPRTFTQEQKQTEMLGLVAKSKGNAHFPSGNFFWEFWTTIQEIPFSPDIFRLGRPN